MAGAHVIASTGGDPARDADLCACGHIRLDHQDMEVAREKLGHCYAPRCECRRYREEKS